jgi:hypothetical protein
VWLSFASFDAEILRFAQDDNDASLSASAEDKITPRCGKPKNDAAMWGWDLGSCRFLRWRGLPDATVRTQATRKPTLLGRTRCANYFSE